MATKPKHTRHSCKTCKFLGTDSSANDWYICTPGKGYRRTLLKRHGSGGPEYTSNTIGIGGHKLTPLECQALLMGFEFTEEELRTFADKHVERACVDYALETLVPLPKSVDEKLLGNGRYAKYLSDEYHG